MRRYLVDDPLVDAGAGLAAWVCHAGMVAESSGGVKYREWRFSILLRSSEMLGTRDRSRIQQQVRLFWASALAELVHELWEEIGDDGVVLHSCCLAGPMGAACRRALARDARLLTTLAGSHFEAMTTYNLILGREPYTTDQPWDRQPYPEGWLRQQQEGQA